MPASQWKRGEGQGPALCSWTLYSLPETPEKGRQQLSL